MNYCPNCGNDVEENHKYCWSCGAELKPYTDTDGNSKRNDNFVNKQSEKMKSNIDCSEEDEKDIFSAMLDRMKQAKTHEVGIVGKVVDWGRNIMGLLFAIYGLQVSATDMDFEFDFMMSVFFVSTMAIWYRLMWKGKANYKIETVVPFLVLFLMLIVEMIRNPV